MAENGISCSFLMHFWLACVYDCVHTMREMVSDLLQLYRCISFNIDPFMQVSIPVHPDTMDIAQPKVDMTEITNERDRSIRNVMSDMKLCHAAAFMTCVNQLFDVSSKMCVPVCT